MRPAEPSDPDPTSSSRYPARPDAVPTGDQHRAPPSPCGVGPPPVPQDQGTHAVDVLFYATDQLAHSKFKLRFR